MTSRTCFTPDVPNTMVFKIIFSLFFFFHFGVNTYAQVISANSCDYYYQKEDQMKCGDQGYLKTFAIPYCEKFLNLDGKNLKSLGPKGKKWLQDVRLCLQEKVKSFDEVNDCSDLSQLAFDSHVSCYVETGFCDLSAKSKLKIVSSLSQSIFSKELFKVFSSGIGVENACYSIKKYHYELAQNNVYMPRKYSHQTAQKIIEGLYDDEDFSFCYYETVRRGSDDDIKEYSCSLIPYFHEPISFFTPELIKTYRQKRNLKRRNKWIINHFGGMNHE